MVESMVRIHLLPPLGSVRVGALTVEDVEGWLDAKAGTMAKSSLIKLPSTWRRRSTLVFVADMRCGIRPGSPTDCGPHDGWWSEGYWALRISAGCDGGEQVPVGPSGVEESSDSVVPKPLEAEGDPLDPFDQVVGGFGWSVCHVGLVPSGDLVPPPQEVRPNERTSGGQEGS